MTFIFIYQFFQIHFSMDSLSHFLSHLNIISSFIIYYFFNNYTSSNFFFRLFVLLFFCFSASSSHIMSIKIFQNTILYYITCSRPFQYIPQPCIYTLKHITRSKLSQNTILYNMLQISFDVFQNPNMIN